MNFNNCLFIYLFLKGIIATVPVPFPIPNSKGCELGAKCPIAQSDVNTVSLALPVLASYPSISLYVRLEVKADDPNKDYTCLQFAATITGANHERSLVGWQKGKLFEMLD
jgi:hypothetical protein